MKYHWELDKLIVDELSGEELDDEEDEFRSHTMSFANFADSMDTLNSSNTCTIYTTITVKLYFLYIYTLHILIKIQANSSQSKLDENILYKMS
jgi:hypothetical protein